MKWFDWKFESIAALIKNNKKEITQICFLIQFHWMEYENTDLNCENHFVEICRCSNYLCALLI